MMNLNGKGGIAMKTKFIFMLSFAVVAMSCVKEVITENNLPEENVESVLIPMEFTTSLETKAGIVDEEMTVEWAENDAITIFDNLGGKNTFTTAVGGANSLFSGEVTEGSTEFYALYPQRTSSAKFDTETKVITSKLFPDQNAVVGSYAVGNGGAVMVAKADDENRLYFKNMTSHIRFTLAEDMTNVKSITLMGNKNEAIAGQYKIDFSGSEPVITVSTPDTYVTLRRNDGENLVPGDYFFTVLPVKFAEGFTVILSMADGTQVAKKTTKEITALNKRNQVLPMAALPSSAYKNHMNYFVKYNDGFDITIGGYTFSKTTHETVKLVNDTYANGNVNADGLYFIDPSCTVAKFSKAQAYSNLVVVGSDASVRSKFDFNRQGRPLENGSVILMANLDCTVGAKNAFAQNTETKDHSFTKFGDIIFSNCHFRNVGKNFMEFKSSAFTNVNVNIEDCEFGFNAAAVYVLNASSLESVAQNITMKNNVFYAESGTTMTAFKLIHSDKLSIEKLNVDRNTYVGTVVETNILRLGDVSTTLDFSRNLFVECSTDTDIKLITLRVGTNKAKVTGVITNNYYYTTGSAAIGMGVGKSALSSMETINSTAVMTSSPLSATWNPAAGTFGPYAFAEGVSNTVGAWRADMKVTAETANCAAAGYTSVELGTL